MYFVQKNPVPTEQIIPVVDLHNKDLFFTNHLANTVLRTICTGPKLTAPYKFGKQFDILALALPTKHSRSIDPAMAIELVYFTINDVLYCINIEGDDRNYVTYNDPNTKRGWIKLYSEHMHTSRLLPYLAEPHQDLEAGYLSFAILGDVDLETGMIEIKGEVLVNQLSTDVKIELKGYTLKAFYAKQL